MIIKNKYHNKKVTYKGIKFDSIYKLCGEEKENKGRNLCRNCYAKELRKGNLFKYERIYKKK